MNQITVAAQLIKHASALVIAAGAGMSVDSGLADFRGAKGFWRAYPPLAELGLRFEQLANPQWFLLDPELAWGFYGHRFNLYRQTQPHQGFSLLHRWAARAEQGAFVVTSNVDGHFQRAGFDVNQVYECHGSLSYLQCTEPCSEQIWPADDLHIVIDEETFRAEEPLPRCPRCGAMARPNVLMFSDGQWLWNRSNAQEQRFEKWLMSLEDARVTVIECGAGTAVPTVRAMSENLLRAGADLIRINPHDLQAPPGALSLPMGALEALQAIEEHLSAGS